MTPAGTWQLRTLHAHAGGTSIDAVFAEIAGEGWEPWVLVHGERGVTLYVRRKAAGAVAPPDAADLEE